MRWIAFLLLLGCVAGCHRNVRPRWELSFQVGATSKFAPETTVTTSLVLKRPLASMTTPKAEVQ